MFGDREYFYKSVMKMMGSLFENIESLDDNNYDDNDDVGGYKNDREQLNIPTIQKSQRDIHAISICIPGKQSYCR